MKWFKHISDSINDPFIRYLMQKFGPFGYLAFFGILEIYGREFKIADDWKLEVTTRFIRDSLHQKTARKLNSFLSNVELKKRWAIIKSSKDGIEWVSIYVPKFLEIIDDTTRKKFADYEEEVRNHSGIIPPKKKKKKKKKESIKEKAAYGEFSKVKLTADEHKKLLDKYGTDQTLDYIGKVDRYIMTKGRNYKSHYATILSWMNKDKIGSVKDTRTNTHPTCSKCKMSASNITRGKACPYCGEMIK